ncbi:DedA family protein [Rhodopseudomonas palustris]|uniref:SNARE associated Golgi protein-related protein n=1 Tax=Rhodopseudomonas palustris (strain DX-1) TaxID=652103 RepID=E6VKP1_RHOPX|nr:DedA family protein [Rhodopseudomonas palustris]
MSSFLDSLVAFAAAHAGWAYLVLFLAALLEAVPVLGSLVPGSTVILALSALIPGGELNPVGVLASAIAGALIGDGAAYWTGRRAQRRILSAWPLSTYPDLVARAESFFRRWGVWAVLFGRFVPPIRAFVPVTAGALQMTPQRFFAVDVPAILIWAPAHVLPGVLAATVLERDHATLHHWLPVVAGVAGMAVLGVWAYRRRRSGTQAR